jgi:hypothetical protein
MLGIEHNDVPGISPPRTNEAADKIERKTLALAVIRIHSVLTIGKPDAQPRYQPC